MVVTRDENYDSLLVFAYVKDCFKDNKMMNVQKLPFELIDLIANCVCNETLHLIEDDGESLKKCITI